MANFFSKLLGAGAGGLIDSIGNAIYKTVTSDEERKALENELAKAQMQYDAQKATLGLQETQAYLGDIGNARDNQSRVQESQNASWLAKNIQPVLASFIIGLTFWMYWHIIFSGEDVLSKNPAMKDIMIYILGALTMVAIQVVSYFFGSSKGSADKSKSLAEIMNKP